MSEDQITPNQIEEEDQGPTEEEMFEALKQKATLLGVKFSPNIGMDSLRKRIAEAQAEPSEVEASDSSEGVMSKAAIRAQQRKEQLKLVRLRIANMNPSKSDLGGEIFTVRTKYLGIIKKFVPYGEATDEGYHVPHIIYQQLKDRKFLQTKVKKSKNGQQLTPQSRWVPEFSLEVLPPLKPEELAKLANHQAAAAGMAE